MSEESKTGIELIAEERERQIAEEGWTAQRDDRYTHGELALAAEAYLTSSPSCWPWDSGWWKPGDPVRDLVKAGALIAAEIDRLQRKEGDQ